MIDGGRCTILVTDAGRGSAVSIIRSLGRRGHRIVAVDCARLSPGFRSRYTAARVVAPDPANRPNDFAEAVARAVVAQRVDLVVPVTEEAILALGSNPARLNPRTRLAIASEPALETVRDKWATVELARRLGVPVPRTNLVTSSDDIDTAADGMAFPVVVKPRRSRVLRHGRIEAFAVSYAGDEAELRSRVESLIGRTDILVQEFVEGEGHGVELCMRDGEPLAAFQHRRLREVPVTGGASSYREGVPLDPELYRCAVDLLRELRWTGLAMVEFKLGRGGPWLMEVNGRVWGSLPLGIASGVEFGLFLPHLFLGQPSPAADEPIGEYVPGIRSHDLGLELVWIASVLRGQARYSFLPLPPRRAIIPAALSLVDPRTRHDMFSVDDPVPGLADLVRVAGRMAMKVLHG
jgi:predicted ATP-grasp superfamily ATP-dependent carboligase